MLARFTIVATLLAAHVHCTLGAGKQLDSLRNALRAESRGLARRLQDKKTDPFSRPPVRRLAGAQAVLGDIDGAIKTASIPQAVGDKGRLARFEALGDVAEIVAGGKDMERAMAIVEGAQPEVKIRVLLAFAVANAKRKVPSVKEAFTAAHVLARKFKRRAKVNVLRSIAAAESKAGDSKGALKTCMQALEAARLFTSPRERAWTLTSIARTMAATGHKDAAARLADETLSVIAKVSGLQAEEIKIGAMSDVASVLGKCHEFKKAHRVLDDLPGKQETVYGEKADALVSLALSANEAGNDSEYAGFLRNIASKKKHDEVVKAAVEKHISKGKHADALEAAKGFKTDDAWGESMLRIALGLAKSGDTKQAWKILRGIEGDLFSDCDYDHVLKWFVLKVPSTWGSCRSLDADVDIRSSIAAVAVPLWYELIADGELTKSPVELIKPEDRYAVYVSSGAIFEALAQADAYCNDPDVVMRWAEPFLKNRSPGGSDSISFFTTIATQAARRLREPPRARRKKTATTVPADVKAAQIPEIDNSLPAILRRQLAKQFLMLASDPKSYRAKVLKECARFPEGDLFPYTLPAIAYANMTLSDPLIRTDALKEMCGLLDQAIANTIAKVKPPGGKLERLTSYKKHATYLGQLNMALGYYRLIGGDDRYQPINKAISDVLHKALVELKGRPLESFPTYSWTFDTIPALVSLKLYDHNTDTERSDAVIRQHLDWMSKNAIHKPTNLPYSRISPTTGKGIALPRGCDLSWRISMIVQLDARLAKTMYDSYMKSFWLDRKIVSGFAEWPGGKAGKQDADSGPILMGVGMSASGMGIGAAASAGDTRRRDQLIEQTVDFKSLMRQLIAAQPKMRTKLTLGGRIDPASDYITGFLYGDACLFYAATWEALPTKKVQPTTQPKPDQPTTKAKPTDSPRDSRRSKFVRSSRSLLFY